MLHLSNFRVNQVRRAEPRSLAATIMEQMRWWCGEGVGEIVGWEGRCSCNCVTKNISEAIWCSYYTNYRPLSLSTDVIEPYPRSVTL